MFFSQGLRKKKKIGMLVFVNNADSYMIYVQTDTKLASFAWLKVDALNAVM